MSNHPAFRRGLVVIALVALVLSIALLWLQGHYRSHHWDYQQHNESQLSAERSRAAAAKPTAPVTSTPPSVPAEPIPLPEADTQLAVIQPLSPFLRDAHLWMHDSTSNKDTLISPPSWRIDRIALSPNQRYVAATRITDWIDSPGIFADTTSIPKEPTHNVSIFSCETGRLIRDIDPPEDIFLSMGNKWYSNSRLVLLCSDGFALNAIYVYDAYRDSLQKAPYTFGRSGP